METEEEVVGLEMRYFVLKPEGNTPYHKASRAAMLRYADMIEKENPQLANDIKNWWARIV